METFNTTLPGHRVNEYQLVLAPHADLRDKIVRLKEEFSQSYGSAHSKVQRPHITLVRFQTWELMEEKLRQRLQIISMGITPFKVELKDFGSFPSHSIFIQVTTRVPVQNLVKQLKEGQRIMRMNQENRAHFIDEPYILIGSKLKPWQYEQGWQQFSHRQFTGRFIADSMLLLSRPAGSRSAYRIADRFEFRDLPVLTTQGSLFT